MDATTAAETTARVEFDDEVWLKLVILRERVRRGQVNELTNEQCRLEFARWLYQHGKIGE